MNVQMLKAGLSHGPYRVSAANLPDSFHKVVEVLMRVFTNY